MKDSWDKVSRSLLGELQVMERENEMIVISQPLFALHILLHEHIDRLIHARDGLLVILLHRFYDAVLHMLL